MEQVVIALFVGIVACVAMFLLAMTFSEDLERRHNERTTQLNNLYAIERLKLERSAQRRTYK